MAQPTVSTPAPSPSFVGRVTGGDELGIILALPGMVAFIGLFKPGFLTVDSLCSSARCTAWYGIGPLRVLPAQRLIEERAESRMGALTSIAGSVRAIVDEVAGWQPEEGRDRRVAGDGPAGGPAE